MRLARGVINPQNGHTLCSRTSETCGLSFFSNVPRDDHTEARRRRKEGRYDSIRLHLCVASPLLSNPRQFNDDTRASMNLFRIAHIAFGCQLSMAQPWNRTLALELSNSDQQSFPI